MDLVSADVAVVAVVPVVAVDIDARRAALPFPVDAVFVFVPVSDAVYDEPESLSEVYESDESDVIVEPELAPAPRPDAGRAPLPVGLPVVSGSMGLHALPPWPAYCGLTRALGAGVAPLGPSEPLIRLLSVENTDRDLPLCPDPQHGPPRKSHRK